MSKSDLFKKLAAASNKSATKKTRQTKTAAKRRTSSKSKLGYNPAVKEAALALLQERFANEKTASLTAEYILTTLMR